MWSMRNPTDRISESLLLAGANVHATYGDSNDYDKGSTPLMMAASMGSVKIVKAIVAKGADVNAQTKHLGFTPIMEAVAGHASFNDEFGIGEYRVSSDKYRRVIEILQNAGADINTKDFFNDETALFLAVRNGDGEMIKILAKLGASFVIPNRDGQDVTSLATQLGEPQVLTALLELELGWYLADSTPTL